jgi:ATP-dependent exoDNAse (exonuclease V) beta subunit
MNRAINDSSLNVYRSSAGSGKTYTLVNVYLKLLFSSPSDYSFKSILAITFTNKAAEEMKQRVISTLEMISDGNKIDVQTYLSKELSIKPSLIKSRARSILSKIIHNYSDVSILTIDRFTHKIIKSFSKELGLSFQYDIELEEKIFLEECIIQLLDYVGSDKELTKYLNEMVDESVRKSENFNIERQLNLFKDLLFKSDRDDQIGALEKLNIKEFSQLRATVIKSIEISAVAIKEIANQGRELINKSGLPDKAFSRKKCHQVFNVFVEDDVVYYKFLEKINRWIDEEKWFNKAFINDSAAVSFGPKFMKLASNISSELGTYFKYLEIKKHFTAFSLVFLLIERIEKTKKNKGIILISDFNKLISEIIENEPAGFIYERLGSRFNHVLIDEFQDTSSKQWSNLLPLVHESLSNGGTNLLVGDAKQAIYRWRDGDVTQFVNLPEIDSSQKEFASLLSQYYKEHKLDNNWRSSKSIVMFNNDLFSEISAKFNHSSISDIYKDVKQKIVNKDVGKVEVSIVDKNLFDLKDFILRRIELSLEQGFSYKDINVLVRVKKEGMLVAEVFNETDIPFVSDDSVFLGSSSEYKFLFHFIQFLENQNQYSKLYILKRLESDSKFSHKSFDWDLIYSSLKDFSINDLLIHFNEIDLISYFSLSIMERINYIIHALKIDVLNPYIDKLLEITWSFFYANSCTMYDLLEMWKEKELKISVDLGTQNAVRIITIHKSKGLEFPVVIIPFGSWKNTNSNNQSYVWLNHEIDKDLGLSNFIAPMSRTSLSRLSSDEVYEKEMELSFLDNINLYYVAFTRAINQLYICMNPTSSLTNVSDFVFEFIINHSCYDNQINQLSIGEYGCNNKAEINLNVNNSNNHYFNFIPSQLPNSIPLVLPKGFYKNDQILYGDYFHLIMEKIFTDFNTGQLFNKELYLSNIISKKLFEEFNNILYQISNNSQLQFLFDHNSTIYNEREIYLKDNHKFIIDKLILTEDGQTYVLDYKTGEQDSKHIKQVKQYMDALKEVGYENCEGYLLYIPSMKLVQV